MVVFGVAAGGIWYALLDILILLGAAMVLGAVAERLHQNAIVGYLLAGMFVGPHALGWVTSQEDIFGMAEMGVALLLFAIGLEFSPPRLLSLGRLPLIAGPVQVLLTMVAAAAASLAMGLETAAAMVMGALLALSSTASVLRLLNDRAEIDSPYGRISLGILLVQDVAVVPLMLIVTVLVRGGTASAMVWELSVALGSAGLLVGAFYLVFNYVVPRLLRLRTLGRNRDLPILLAVVMALGSAWMAQQLGLSPALGAFVAGVLLGVSPFAVQIRADIQPVQTVLVTLFFASVGMFADANWLVGHLGLVLLLAAAIAGGKACLTALIVRACGQPLQFAVASGLCLAQVGEFSFVLAIIARGDQGTPGLLSEDTFRAFVSATILTLLLTPYFVAFAPRARVWLRHVTRWGRKTPMAAAAGETEVGWENEPREEAGLILIVGFGPAGQRAVEDLLNAHQQRLVVVDLNHENVQLATEYGVAAVIGDATRTEILEHAGLHRAAIVVVAIPSPIAARNLVNVVRQLAPHATLVVRSRYHIHRWEFVHAGADVVIDEEDEVGHRLGLEVAQLLGASSNASPFP